MDNNIDNNLLDKYRDELLTELGLNNQSPEDLEEIKAQIQDLISDRVINLVLIYLPDEKVQECNEMIDKSPQEEVIQYLFDNIPDFNTKVAEEMISIKKELVEALKK